MRTRRSFARNAYSFRGKYGALRIGVARFTYVERAILQLPAARQKRRSVRPGRQARDICRWWRTALVHSKYSGGRGTGPTDGRWEVVASGSDGSAESRIHY